MKNVNHLKTLLKIAAIIIGVFLANLTSIRAAAEGNPLDVFVLNAHMAQRYGDEETWMEETRREVLFDNGKMTSNCEGYLRERKNSFVVYEYNNFAFDCASTDCLLLDAFRNARPHDGYRPESYALELYRRLDLGSCSAFLGSNPENMGTPEQLNDPDLKIEDAFTLNYLKEGAWEYEIQVVSDADLNGNGKPDWQLFAFDHALGGHHIACYALVIYDVEPTGLLKVQLYGK